MSLIRSILSFYRKIQYTICGRKEKGIMPSGVMCHHEPFEDEINHGDVVHPCVRYISDGYLGHKWWMVYTPYYAANDATENPVLCYADVEDNTPPKDWKIAYQVQGQPLKGYNSDPTLFYDDNKLYVMWRENSTERCDKTGHVRATFGAEVKIDGIGTVFGPLIGTRDDEIDNGVSPTFLRNKDGSYVCYAMHIKFHSKFIKSLPFSIRKIANILVAVFDLVGFWSQQKSYGIAIWKSNLLQERFKYERTVPFLSKNRLYRPWHMDLFDYNEKRYAIVQTNQCNADICLAESKDNINFKFLIEPLMTNDTCKKVGIYKSTGLVIDDEFCLYYTAQDKGNRALNKLYLSKIPFDKICY